MSGSLLEAQGSELVQASIEPQMQLACRAIALQNFRLALD